jgi:hypothetical protein
MVRSLVGAFGLGADIVVLGKANRVAEAGPDAIVVGAGSRRRVALPTAKTRWPFASSIVRSMAGTMLRAGSIRSLSTSRCDRESRRRGAMSNGCPVGQVVARWQFQQVNVKAWLIRRIEIELTFRSRLEIREPGGGLR